MVFVTEGPGIFYFNFAGVLLELEDQKWRRAADY
jgi:hypothetical protein